VARTVVNVRAATSSRLAYLGGPRSSWQFGDVRGDAPRLVAREQTGSRSSARLLFEIDVGERLPVRVSDDEAPPIQLWIGLLDGRGRREEARRRAWNLALLGLYKVIESLSYRPHLRYVQRRGSQVVNKKADLSLLPQAVLVWFPEGKSRTCDTSTLLRFSRRPLLIRNSGGSSPRPSPTRSPCKKSTTRRRGLRPRTRCYARGKLLGFTSPWAIRVAPMR
jgi:hypothetical protein